MIEKLYEKWKMSFFILLLISIILAFSAFQIEVGECKNSKYNVFSVVFEYYGIDAKQIEELITIPLEEGIMSNEGLLELRSTIEYGKSITNAFFSKTVDYKKTYMNIRETVERLYNILPGDVQKPSIQSTSSEDKAFFCVSFTGNSIDGNMRSWIENNIKKEIESIDGVAEVIVSGGNINEIEIAFDSEKVVALGQNPSMLSTIVRDGNSVNSGSKITYENFFEDVVFDTKLHTLDEIRELPIKTKENYTTLGYFADVEIKSRLDNEIVRINGKDCISVGVKASSNGNLISISKKCRKIIEGKKNSADTYQYLFDDGQALEKLIKKTLLAAFTSFLCIILIIPFFFNSFRIMVLSIVFLLINSIWVIGLLQIFGLSLDQNTLSGLTIALGLAADSIFVIAETSESAISFESFINNFKKLIPSIIAASMTSLLVLIPLLFLDEIIPGMKNISITIILMIIVSMVLSIIFFPIFLYEKKELKKHVVSKLFYKTFNNFIRKKIISYSVLSIKHFRLAQVIYIFFIIVPFVIFIFIGKDLSFSEDKEVIFCSVEFEPEDSSSFVNDSINDLIYKINENTGVTFVRSEARKGNAQIEVGFNEKRANKSELTNYIMNLAKYVPNGFLYVPGSSKKNVKHHILEIAAVGDESSLCREYAGQAAEILKKSGLCNSIVLNFKRPEVIFEFMPSKEIMNRNAITTQQIASGLRWMLFGPVADKWLEDGKEVDIRIRGKNLQRATSSELENLYLPIENSAIRVKSIGEINKKEGQGKIYRKDQKRCAFFTIEISKRSLNKIIKELRFFLSKLDLKKGYGFSFSQEVETLSSQYRVVFITLILSIIGVILLLTVLTERIGESLKITSIIPLSFLLPLLIRVLTKTPLQLGDITGMVILSGIGVNNSIYMIVKNSFQPIFKFRSKCSSIMITSLTSIVSAVPLLCIKGESFSKSLSFFMVWGIAGTLFICMFIFPGFIHALQRSRKKHS